MTPTPTPTILVVDDEPVARDTVEALLASEGYHLVFAADGERALEKAEAICPDVVLLDIMLPGIDGFEVCRKLRGDPHLGEIPVVMLTALDDRDSRLASIEAGADDFMTKPLDREALRARLRSITRLNRFRRLLQQRESFDQVVELAPVGTLVVDARGAVGLANPAALRMLGAEDADQVLGRDFADFGVERALLAPLRDGNMSAGAGPEAGAVRLEHDLMRLDGGSLPVEMDIGAFTWKGLPACLVMVRDITERTRAERELDRYRNRLEELVELRTKQLSDAYEELESFSYSVSHDLRAPLRSIRGFCAALREEYGEHLDAVAQDYLRRVEVSGRRMGELIDALLTLSRLSRADLHRQHLDLSALAVGVGAQTGERYPGRTVHLVVQPDMAVQGDARLVRILIENLVDNAWKYTARRGQATVEVGALPTDGETVYFVRDNGAGFDMAYADKLFTPFQRLHHASDYPGTGIGLATVRRIVTRHGGRIWAEGKVDRGATIYFTLPRSVGPSCA
jgi:PAS domain S-box-containing protein